jgi:hypothetical protein
VGTGLQSLSCPPIAMVMPKVGPSPAQASWISTGTLRSRKITHMRTVRLFPASHVKVRVPSSRNRPNETKPAPIQERQYVRLVHLIGSYNVFNRFAVGCG